MNLSWQEFQRSFREIAVLPIVYTKMIIRSLASQWFSTAYVAGISILLTFYFARFLGPESFGLFSYLVTIGSIVAIFQDGGFRTIIFKELTVPSFNLKEENLISAALRHNLIITLASILIVSFLIIENQLLLTLAFISFGLGMTTNFISAKLKGHGNFSTEAGWRISIRTLTAVSILSLLFFMGQNIQSIFLGWILGYVIALGLRRKDLKWKFDSVKIDSKVYKSIVALLIIDVATTIYFKIDIVMLSYLGKGPEQVGYYAAGSRLMEGLIFIHLPFATVFFRELRIHVNNYLEFSKLLAKLLLFALIPPILMIPVGWLFGREILSFCYGENYGVGYDIFQWLLFSLVFMIPNLVVTQGTLAFDREAYYAWGACFAAILNIALNWFLIPEYGPKGAAIGTFATEGFLLAYIGIGLIYSLKKKIAHESK